MPPSARHAPTGAIILQLWRGALLPIILSFFALGGGCGRSQPFRPLPGTTEAPPYLGEWTPSRSESEFEAAETVVRLATGDYLVHVTRPGRVERLGPRGERLGQWPTATDTSRGVPEALSAMRLGQDGLLYFIERNCSFAEMVVAPIPAFSCRRALVRYDVAGTFRGRLPLFADDSLHVQGDPRDYAVDAAGQVFVLEDGDPAGGSRVLKFDASGRPLLQFGSRGSGDAEFERASGLELAADGSCFVIDNDLQRIQRFAPDGHFLAQVLDAEGNDSSLNFYGFEITPDDRIHLAIYGAALQSFGLDGAPLGSLTLEYEEGGETLYYLPDFDALALDPGGSLLALLGSPLKLVHFAASGLSDFELGGAAGPAASDFSYLTALVAAPGGGALGLTEQARSILHFRPDGSVARIWEQVNGQPGDRLRPMMAADARGRVFLLEGDRHRLLELLADGTLRHAAEVPLPLWDLARVADHLVAGQADDFYLSRYDGVVAHFDRAGTILGRIGGSPANPTPIAGLRALAVDPGGLLWALEGGERYVRDPDGHAIWVEAPRVSAFDGTGAPLISLPLDSEAVGVRLNPQALAFDGAGRMLVTGLAGRTGVVLRLDERGRPLARWGPGLAAPAAFGATRYAVVDALDRLFLYDGTTDRVIAFGGSAASGASGRVRP